MTYYKCEWCCDIAKHKIEASHPPEFPLWEKYACTYHLRHLEAFACAELGTGEGAPFQVQRMSTEGFQIGAKP